MELIVVALLLLLVMTGWNTVILMVIKSARNKRMKSVRLSWRDDRGNTRVWLYNLGNKEIFDGKTFTLMEIAEKMPPGVMCPRDDDQ